MSNNFRNRLDYAYELSKLIFSRDERLDGCFPESNGKSKNKRIPFDPDRILLLKSIII